MWLSHVGRDRSTTTFLLFADIVYFLFPVIFFLSLPACLAYGKKNVKMISFLQLVLQDAFILTLIPVQVDSVDNSPCLDLRLLQE